jgi:hypothetical protein
MCGTRAASPSRRSTAASSPSPTGGRAIEGPPATPWRTTPGSTSSTRSAWAGRWPSCGRGSSGRPTRVEVQGEDSPLPGRRRTFGDRGRDRLDGGLEVGHRLGESLQLHGAAVHHRNPFDLACELGHPLGDQHVPGPRLGAKACGEIQRRAPEPVLHGDRLTGRQADPGEQGKGGVPADLLSAGGLELQRGAHRLSRVVEHRQDLVPAEFDHPPTARLDRVAGQAGERPRQAGGGGVTVLGGEPRIPRMSAIRNERSLVGLASEEPPAAVTARPSLPIPRRWMKLGANGPMGASSA